jgi:pilus assembly protein CpaF
MPDADLRRLVEEQVDSVQRLPEFANDEDRATVRTTVLNDLLGFGPIQDLLDDPSISEIMVNGPDDVFVERSGVIGSSNSRFDSTEQLLRVIDRMVRSSGRRVDQSSPMVDARLPDGSRLNVVLPPLSVDGPAVTIRKFTSSGLSTDDLVQSGTLSTDSALFLEQAVAARMNILVSGGTGTGKTTVLNILSSFIGKDERVVTIEDAVELSLRMPNLIRLEARPGNSEGAGEVHIRDLVRNSLRMRPNRIVVGEVRGAETIDMLQAMNTGHEGSLSTVHANSPRDALRRLETMILLAGVDLPLRAVREQASSAIDLIVHLARDARGRRFVTAITEVVGMEGDVVSTADLFVRDFRANHDVESLAPLERSGLVSQRFGLRSNKQAA